MYLRCNGLRPSTHIRDLAYSSLSLSLSLSLTITRPNISFDVSVVNQFLNSPFANHWDVVIILKYIKGSPRQGLLYGHNNHNKVV